MTQLRATDTIAELTMENKRLRAELRERVDELRGCRGRIVDAIDAERRRIERDLHDGTQARLVSLAMSLGLLEAKLATDPDAARPIAPAAREAVAATLDELRKLSQGIYPAALAERGLGSALTELCERAALPVHLQVSLDRRLPAEVEAAGYYVVSEALTNAAKHARATQARVAATRHQRELVVEVADDGIGGAICDSGTSGLRGLADRVERLGGRMTLSSPPGRGTTIRTEIPCRW
jgi:signal transduction histidine kinase